MAQEAKFEIGIKALFLNSGKKILILRSGPAEMKHSNVEFWDLPGGRIQPDADIMPTLQRELKEELGFGKADFRVDGLHGAGIAKFKAKKKGGLRLMLITYRCRLLNTKKAMRLSEEHDEYRWASIGEAKMLLSTKFPTSFLKTFDGL